ncbi:T9SS type A sorting domain-containing protein [Fluviicola sp.]|uniref:T9SS type A sorting domain-containing protein n=1 Tax=Fluviicola sp. TaxID=1917219 RepID=UPI003D29B20E
MKHKLQLKLILATFLILVTQQFNLFAQFGANDPTFNTIDPGFDNGSGNGVNSTVSATSIQSDGKTIVGGDFTSVNGNAFNRIVRLNSDGSPDASFNPGTAANNSVYATNIQPDGKIIVGGAFTAFDGVGPSYLVRLNSDGSLDPSFNPILSSSVYAIELQSDGKIVIGGDFTSVNGISRQRVARLNTNGSLDVTFNPGVGADGTVYKIAIQPDNKIIIAGIFTYFNSILNKRIVRLNSNGSLDSSFSTGTGINNTIITASIQSDGKILIGGHFTTINDITQNRLARLNPDGSLDPSFDLGTGINTGGVVHSIVIQSNNQILVGGGFTSINGILKSNICRLNLDGSIDANFNSKTSGAIKSFSIRSDGRIIIAGGMTSVNAVTRGKIARLYADGLLDLGFNPPTGLNLDVSSITVQPDDKILISGGFTHVNGNEKNHLARLNSDGSIDSTFDVGINPNITVVCTKVQSDGKIIVGGTFSSINGVAQKNITRLNPDGSIDLSFNTGTGFNGTVFTVLIQSDNKILVGGSFVSFNGVTRYGLVRLNTNGTLDLSFDNSTSANIGFPISLVQQADNKIIVGQNYTTVSGVPMTNLYRLNLDGSLDATFNVTNNGANGNIVSVHSQADGKIVIAGSFTTINGVGKNNIARLNTDGTIDATFDIGTGLSTQLRSLSVQSNGKMIVGGLFTSVNGIPRNRIARLNVDGSLDTTFNPGTGANNFVNATGIQSDGKVIIGGTFTSYNGSGRNRIARIIGCIPSSSSISVTSCDHFVLNGQTYTSSGLYTQVLSNSTGCDSTVTLNLTITHSNTGTDIQTACDSYTWIDGNTYTSSTNTPTFVLQNAAGCDSTVTLNLTITHSNTGTDIQTACDSYTWIDGNTYTSSTNIPTFVLQNAAGCDSTVTLNLTITNSTTGTDIQTACDLYTWIDGNVYTSSTNIPTFVLQNAAGCDSTVTLNLTITNSTTGTDIQTACDSYTWIDGNTYTSSTNSPTFVLQNAAGCDSTVTLNLTITHSNTGTAIQTACDSYTWIDGNTYTSSTNTPTFVLQNAAGCDSTVTLNLTITNSTTGTDIQTACDSYTWIDGNTYTSSTNSPTFVLQNAAGCDSTVTLNLTITNSTSGTDIQTACDSYTWIDGNVYTSSTNTPTFVLQNAAGCDSTVTLNLTITNSTSGTDIQTACDSYTWIDGNTYTVSTNTPTFMLQNAAGCDSTVTLNLTMTNSNTGTDIQTACDSYTWIDGNTYTSSTNSPTFVLQNAAGCDSTITLNLTIIPSLPLLVENVFVFPSDANSCTGEAAIDLSGNADFELDFDTGAQIVTSNGYSLVTGLCAGVHDLHVTDNCGDTLSLPVVIPIDSNFVFNNPFIDSLAQDSLGVTMTNCDIYYAGIDTAYIDSIWATGNTVNVIWNIVDSNGSNFDTTSYILNNGNGVYWLQLSVFCPNKSVGEYFTVTEAIYFQNGHVSTAGLSDYETNLFEVYPNPTNHEVHINFSGSDAELTVYDVQGKVVLKDKIQNQGIISLQNFERGVYLFDFKNSQGHSVQRVVKQ